MCQEYAWDASKAEFKGLDKTISELSSDRETTNTEQSAVMDYSAQLTGRCVAKPESYEQRKASVVNDGRLD